MKQKTARKLKIRARYRQVREDHLYRLWEDRTAAWDLRRRLLNAKVEDRVFIWIGSCLCRGMDFDCAEKDSNWKEIL